MTNPAKVLIVVADDMPETGFHRKIMPKTWNLLVDRGVLFRKGYAVDPLCAPSRATFLTGLWVHNHGFINGLKDDRVDWYGEHRESDTIATRAKAVLGDAGRTAMIGKYLNRTDRTDPTRVPPGWDLFIDVQRYGSKAKSYTFHENGQFREVSTAYNDTNLIFDRATQFAAHNAKRPWLLYVAPNAPHGPPTATPKHADDFDGEQLPKGPAYDPTNVPAPEKTVREAYEGMLEECRDIDDGMDRLMAKLHDTGQLNDTLVIFTSDNGYLYGEHSTFKKMLPWEESVGVPFVMRGPDIPAGVRTDALIGHIDLPYTAMAALGASTSGFEGRDMRAFASPDWRKYLLVEDPWHGWYEVVSDPWVYFEDETGKRHLYDMDSDPYQLDNLAGTGKPAEAVLAERLAALKSCQGKTCRAREA